MVQFVVEVVVDPTKAVQGNKKVRGELKKTETAAGKLQKQIQKAFAFAAIAGAVVAVTRLADAYTNIQNRLRIVTSDQRELTTATEELFEISNRTRSSFEGTAEVYARVSLAAQALGRDQAELLQFTESLNQAVILSGASSIEAKAGLIQLSQGLASGALRGDELRSVLEQLPVVADVIAKSLGVTRGELRELGSEGKLSAEIVLDAFKEAREELDERFGKTVATVSQSFGILQNNILKFVGSADEATGASAVLSGQIILLSNNIEVLVGVVGTLGVTFAAVRLLPVAEGALTAAKAFVTLRLAVLSGKAVILGSAAATRLQTAAEVQAAQAILAKTAANLASIKSETAKALVVFGAAQNTFIQAAVETQAAAAQAAHTAAADALTAAQGRLAKATAATTVQARILSVVNPFTIAVAAGVAFGFILNDILSDLEEVELAALRVNEAGNKFQLTEFGKVGADIQRVGESLRIVQENIDRDLTTKGFANPAALKLAERYAKEIEDLVAQQGFLADGTSRTTVQAREQLRLINELADAVDSAVAGFETENTLLALNTRARERQATFLKLVADLEGKEGPAVTDADKEELRLAIARNQELREQAEALNDIRGPQQEFETRVAALGALEAAGTITTQEFTKALADLVATSDDIDLSALSGGGDILAGLRAQLEAVRELANAERIRATVLDELEGPLQGILDKQGVLSQLLQEGAITQDAYNKAFAETEEQVRLLNPEYERQVELLRELDGPTAQLEQRQETLNQLFEKGKIDAETYADELDRITNALNPLTEAQQLQADILRSIIGPAEDFNAIQEALGVLLDKNKISAEEYALALERAAFATGQIGEESSGFQAGLKQIGDQLADVEGTIQFALVDGFNAGKDALVGFVRTGEFEFSSFVNSILDGLAELLVQQALLAAFGGGGAGGFLANIFGGAKQGGGDVNPNQAFLVGEQGPELFTPPGAGKITPAGETAALLSQQAAAPIVNVEAPQVNIRNVIEGEDPDELEDAVLNIIRRNRRSVKGTIG